MPSREPSWAIVLVGLSWAPATAATARSEQQHGEGQARHDAADDATLAAVAGRKVGSPTVHFGGSGRYGSGMAATDVLKPDHAGSRKHFIFTDEHEQLRESIHNFVVKELRPHAEEWEETTFPDWVFQRMGELGFLGLTYPEEYGGQGGDYYCALVLAEEMTHANCGGLGMGIAVHTDMATPPIHLFGTEQQKQDYLVPVDQGREDRLPRHHRARRRLRRGRHQDARRSRTATSTSSTARRPTSPTATAPTSSCSSPRPTPTPATTASRCSSSTWTCPA